MFKRIVAGLIFFVVAIVLLSPIGSAYLAVKVLEVLAAWIVASIVCRIVIKRSLTSLIFGDDND